MTNSNKNNPITKSRRSDEAGATPILAPIKTPILTQLQIDALKEEMAGKLAFLQSNSTPYLDVIENWKQTRAVRIQGDASFSASVEKFQKVPAMKNG